MQFLGITGRRWDANGSKIHMFPTGRGKGSTSSFHQHSHSKTTSQHSLRTSIFTILYNKYSDEFCENWQGPNDSPIRWHMLLFNKVPLDKDPGGAGGTNALGQWVSWAAQPWHTHGAARGVLGGPSRGTEGPPLRLHLDWKVLVTEAEPELSRAPQTALKWARDPVLSSSHCSEEGPRLSTGVGKACVTCFPIQSAWSTVPPTPGVLSPPGVGRSRLPLRANVRRTLWSPAPEQHSGKRGPGPRTDGEQSLNGKGGGDHCGLFLRKAQTMNKALKIHTQTFPV